MKNRLTNFKKGENTHNSNELTDWLTRCVTDRQWLGWH